MALQDGASQAIVVAPLLGENVSAGQQVATDKQVVKVQEHEVVVSIVVKKREEEVLRLASRNAELMSGVLDLEGAPAPASATKRTPPSSGGLVTGFRRNSSFGRRRESGS